MRVFLYRDVLTSFLLCCKTVVKAAFIAIFRKYFSQDLGVYLGYLALETELKTPLDLALCLIRGGDEREAKDEIMLPQRKSKDIKPAGRLIPECKSRVKLAAALWVTAAFFVLLALGASSNVPTVAAPHGIDEGNWFIAQASSGGGGTSAASIYDPLGRIVKIVETRGGTVTSTKQFVWAGDRLCEERDATGNVTRRFFDRGEQISGTNYYYTRDQINSVREMTNSSGVVQSQYGYGPWGQVSKLAGTGPDSDFQYAGMYMHQPSGLNLALNRAYSSSQGRFISRDPIDDPTFADTVQTPEPSNPDAMFAVNTLQMPNPIQSVSGDPVVQAQLLRILPPASSPGILTAQALNPNRYAYVSNNPINITDPTGLQPNGGGEGWRPPCGWPTEWFHCAAKCSAQCANVKNKAFCFQECYRACTHGMDP